MAAPQGEPSGDYYPLSVPAAGANIKGLDLQMPQRPKGKRSKSATTIPVEKSTTYRQDLLVPPVVRKGLGSGTSPAGGESGQIGFTGAE